MKITDLIKLLEEFKEEHGNTEVWVDDGEINDWLHVTWMSGGDIKCTIGAKDET